MVSTENDVDEMHQTDGHTKDVMQNNSENKMAIHSDYQASGLSF